MPGMLLMLLACGPAAVVLGEGFESEAPLPPDIYLGTPLVDFGVVPTSETATKVLVVYNNGESDFTLGEAVLIDNTRLFSLTMPEGRVIAPAASLDLIVTFTPETVLEAEATVLVYSDDPDQPTVDVPLVASSEAPAVRIDPPSWEFGRLDPGCEDANLFTVSNDGVATLNVSALEIAGGDGAFVVDPRVQVNGELPWVLEPGASRIVQVDFVPPYFSTFAGSLVVRSDDPGNPASAALVDGEGVNYTEVYDSFTTDGGTVDVLVAVTSTGITEPFNDMIDAFPDLVAGLDDLLVDFQLSVIVDDNGCTQGPDPFLSSAMTLGDQEDIFAEMLDGYATDHGFLLIEEATEDSKLEGGGCNEGMVRDGARLAIVGITSTPGQPSGGWSHYVSQFGDLVDRASDLEMHGISDKPTYDCGDGATNGWHEAANSTGGADLSICDPESDNFAALAEALAEPQAVYPLTGDPQIDTIVVMLNGVGAGEWTYDDDDNAVVFDRAVAPAIGTDVMVAYDAVAVCP